MISENTPQQEPFVAVPGYEEQHGEPSDGFQIQGEDRWQGLWGGWDQFMDLGIPSGMPSGKLDFEFDMAEVGEEPNAVEL